MKKLDQLEKNEQIFITYLNNKFPDINPLFEKNGNNEPTCFDVFGVENNKINWLNNLTLALSCSNKMHISHFEVLNKEKLSFLNWLKKTDPGFELYDSAIRTVFYKKATDLLCCSKEIKDTKKHLNDDHISIRKRQNEFLLKTLKSWCPPSFLNEVSNYEKEITDIFNRYHLDWKESGIEPIKLIELIKEKTGSIYHLFKSDIENLTSINNAVSYGLPFLIINNLSNGLFDKMGDLIDINKMDLENSIISIKKQTLYHIINTVCIQTSPELLSSFLLIGSDSDFNLFNQCIINEIDDQDKFDNLLKRNIFNLYPTYFLQKFTLEELHTTYKITINHNLVTESLKGSGNKDLKKEVKKI